MSSSSSTYRKPDFIETSGFKQPSRSSKRSSDGDGAGRNKKSKSDAIIRMEKYSENLSKYIGTRKEPHIFVDKKHHAQNIESTSSNKPVNNHRKRGSSSSKHKRGRSSSERSEFSDSKRKSANLEEMKEDEELTNHQTTIYQPKGIKNCILKEHQIEGLNWLIDLYSCQASGSLGSYVRHIS